MRYVQRTRDFFSNNSTIAIRAIFSDEWSRKTRAKSGIYAYCADAEVSEVSARVRCVSRTFAQACVTCVRSRRCVHIEGPRRIAGETADGTKRVAKGVTRGEQNGALGKTKRVKRREKISKRKMFMSDVYFFNYAK